MNQTEWNETDECRHCGGDCENENDCHENPDTWQSECPENDDNCESCEQWRRDCCQRWELNPEWR